MENLNVKTLRSMARDLGITGYSNMKKADLIAAIEECKKDVDVIVPDEPEVEVVEENVDTLIVEESAPEEPKKHNQKRLIEYNGKTQTLTAWAKELGIRHQTLYNRIVMKGWDVDRAFEKPAKKEVNVNAEELETN